MDTRVTETTPNPVGAVPNQVGARNRRNWPAAAALGLGIAVLVSALAVVLLLWYANRTQECYRPDSLHQYAQCVRLHLDGN
ncbi:hypothetical protein [Streptomyces sp. NBC_00525]|uniref:hypothetical protein n=1 Tax=Streptomyces sp. NBC_00525 TaxID=2903660 RepID=UPI002E80E7FD|nr:hypothetical protein [Streptomyces sp. NBC_00525]WUC97973.1 hypothetical protein OG710_30335 [Streptomyces sp. NBC_00525]